MANRCIICHKRIRTGYKYCWEHRHSSGFEKRRRRGIQDITLYGFVLIGLMFFSLYLIFESIKLKNIYGFFLGIFLLILGIGGFRLFNKKFGKSRGKYKHN